MKSRRILAWYLCFSLFVALGMTPALTHAHGGGEGDPLTPQDIEQAIEHAKETFRRHKGTWLLNRTTRIVTRLSDDGDELEVRIYYRWGPEKLYRFFCGYDELERLGCDVVFSGPGAL